MRPLLRPLVALVLVSILLISCTESDVEGYRRPDNPTVPGGAEALTDYWQAGDQVGTALAATDDLWATFAALAADPATPSADVMAAAHAYAAACTLAADELTAWAELEASISSYGGVKSAIDEEARETMLATLEVAADAALTSAEALVVSWQTLGGITSLRLALADPDGTLPVEGLLAASLQQRLEARDDAVVAAIAAGDDRGGALPIDDLEGDNPAEQINDYLGRDDADAVKLACRAAVPSWDEDERDVSLALLERAGRGRLRWFDNAGAGGAPLDGLEAHLALVGQESWTAHETTLDLRDADSGDPITGEALILVRRLDRPAEEPAIALLDGAAAQVIASLPAGDYTIAALADGWARALLPAATVDEAAVHTLTLTSLTAGAILCDGIDGPEMSGAGARVEFTAAAASALGDPLTFTWQIDGPAVTGLTSGNGTCAFYPDEAGEYTIDLQISDASGHSVSASRTLDVKPFAVQVFRTDFVNEQVVDHRFNPGERDTIQFWVANRGDEDVVGDVTMTGLDGVSVDAEPETWTLDAGRQTRWTMPVWIPGDYADDTAVLEFSFATATDTLVQRLEYPVDFYVELNYVNSPVTSRVLPVSGVVANPSLTTANLVVDRDRDLVYPVPLNDGAFEHIIILSGAAETRRVQLEISAEAGSRREQASVGFMAAVTPADFRITLFWNTDGTDVDLWVTDPAGEKCYYANKNTASGLELDVDDVTGYGPENITAESDLPAGTYLVQVHYFSDHSTALASDCTVLVTLNEGTDAEVIEPYQATIVDGDVWTVCEIEWSGEQVTAIRPVTRAPQLHREALPTK